MLAPQPPTDVPLARRLLGRVSRSDLPWSSPTPAPQQPVPQVWA